MAARHVHLPTETWDRVIEGINSRRDLAMLAATSRALYVVCLPHLYGEVDIHAWDQDSSFGHVRAFVNAVICKPAIAGMVRRLALHNDSPAVFSIPQSDNERYHLHPRGESRFASSIIDQGLYQAINAFDQHFRFRSNFSTLGASTPLTDDPILAVLMCALPNLQEFSFILPAHAYYTQTVFRATAMNSCGPFHSFPILNALRKVTMSSWGNDGIVPADFKYLLRNQNLQSLGGCWIGHIKDRDFFRPLLSLVQDEEKEEEVIKSKIRRLEFYRCAVDAQDAGLLLRLTPDVKTFVYVQEQPGDLSMPFLYTKMWVAALGWLDETLEELWFDSMAASSRGLPLRDDTTLDLSFDLRSFGRLRHLRLAADYLFGVVLGMVPVLKSTRLENILPGSLQILHLSHYGQENAVLEYHVLDVFLSDHVQRSELHKGLRSIIVEMNAVQLRNDPDRWEVWKKLLAAAGRRIPFLGLTLLNSSQQEESSSIDVSGHERAVYTPWRPGVEPLTVSDLEPRCAVLMTNEHWPVRGFRHEAF